MDAVVDGVKTTVTFKSDLPADSFNENLYKLSYDKDGYVVEAEVAKHSTTGNDYQWVDEFDPDDTKLIKTSFGTSSQPSVDLTAKGQTLWITNQTVERGFALADECPTVIVEQDKNGDADKVVEYSSVEKAIKALDNYDKENVKNFDGTIIMTVKEGLVTSVILTDTIDKSSADEEGDKISDATIEKKGDKLVAKWTDDGSYNGKKVVVKFYLKEDGKSYLKDTATGTCSSAADHSQSSSSTINQNGDYYAVITVLDADGKVIDKATTNTDSFAF